MRKILRRSSSNQATALKAEKQLKHRRTVTDLSARVRLRKDHLKDRPLQELVRLCGLSVLYLPTEYAVSSLAVPTCFRSTAQYLVQHGRGESAYRMSFGTDSSLGTSTRGIFRIPGSHNTINALYDYYASPTQHGDAVAGTVHSPNLPDHILYGVHDVASTFKRFLAGLPGGILGSVALFEALVAIQVQLDAEPEWTRTKRGKVRARLIALAIATLRSQYRREIICAVFGLLSIIGRAAETAPREDDKGHPLPTSDLMGYGALSIVFGPLLISEHLSSYEMRPVGPHANLILLPSPPKSRKEWHRKNKSLADTTCLTRDVAKIRLANGVTEMIITHWRDVVRQMRSVGALKPVKEQPSVTVKAQKHALRPSQSESFIFRKQSDWGVDVGISQERPVLPLPRMCIFAWPMRYLPNLLIRQKMKHRSCACLMNITHCIRGAIVL